MSPLSSGPNIREPEKIHSESQTIRSQEGRPSYSSILASAIKSNYNLILSSIVEKTDKQCRFD